MKELDREEQRLKKIVAQQARHRQAKGSEPKKLVSPAGRRIRPANPGGHDITTGLVSLLSDPVAALLGRRFAVYDFLKEKLIRSLVRRAKSALEVSAF